LVKIGLNDAKLLQGGYFCSPKAFSQAFNTYSQNFQIIMAVKDKYQNVLDLGEKMGVRDGKVEEANGILRMWGTVENNYEKDQLWDSIKAIGGSHPTDIVVDIQVSNPGVYATHTVKKGESLSLIAKHYYGDLMKYKQIFEANRDQLDNPDKIEVGQVLTIPNP